MRPSLFAGLFLSRFVTVMAAFLLALVASPHAVTAQGTYDESLYDALQWTNVGPPRGGRSQAVAGSVARPFGGAGLSSVVKTTVYLVDMGTFPEMNEIYARHFGDHRPARATVEVAALPKGVDVEIDVIARTS